MSVDSVNENSTARYTATLVDETGALIPGSSLTTLTLTLSDRATGSILNNRSAQNVMNANGVTVYDTLQNGVDADGNAITYNVLWQVSPADNAIAIAGRALEVHIALFKGTWSSGTKEVTHVALITVRSVELT